MLRVHLGGRAEMMSFFAWRGVWAMMTVDDGGGKNCRFFDDVICEWPLINTVIV